MSHPFWHAPLYYRNPGSLVNKLRNRRHRAFLALLAPLLASRRVSVLDIGGTAAYWLQPGRMANGLDITLVNCTPGPRQDILPVVLARAEALPFKDNSFDTVFSNSVIEHIPGKTGQLQMAREIQRVGTTSFIQTPNRTFPLDAHTQLPFFQFLPLLCKMLLIRLFNLRWYPRSHSFKKCREVAQSIQMLTPKELSFLFPKAIIQKEKIGGMCKSLIAITGFSPEHVKTAF